MDRSIARMLLEIGAVSLRIDPPFQWASGRLSPIYCDNRLLMSYPAFRRKVSEGFQTLMLKSGFEPDVIAGTATAGIPHAAWLAERTDLPMIYVRDAAKGHGKQNRIEGALKEGQTVVLIEDLISTGGSSVAAAEGIVEAGGKLLGVLAIFTYGLDVATCKFMEAGIPLFTLTSFEVLRKEAERMGLLEEEDAAVLSEWQRNPALWSETRQ
jgi:orotate phosphoribosyltransferase